ncbi:MAG: type II toxin-antitoxin system PemK/MazF family toxin [Elstera sp.]
MVPERGDLVWLDFDPQAGHEQAGRRPALVLSPAAYHNRTRLAVVCPITTRVKGFPFEVPLPAGLPVSGVILADHVKSVDRAALQLEVAGQAPESVVQEVLAKLAPLLGLRP